MDESPRRDPVVTILFGAALFLVVFLAVAAFWRDTELLKIALVLTGIFAIVGAVLGLVRSLRSGRSRA